MKKKENIPLDDQRTWVSYTKNMGDVYDKDIHLEKRKKNKIKKIRTIDLHGLSLKDANISIRDFINDSFENNYTIIKVITGKGYRSKAKENPYISSELSVLKNSIPEFIRNEENLYNKIDKIYTAKTNEGGEGAFYIELKKIKE